MMGLPELSFNKALARDLVIGSKGDMTGFKNKIRLKFHYFFTSIF
jgi:hypothetical protein